MIIHIEFPIGAKGENEPGSVQRREEKEGS